MIRYIASAIILLTSLGAVAQTTPRLAFTTAPARIVPTIDESTRLDMLDYAESNVAKPSADAFGLPVLITRIDNDAMRVDYGDSTLDIVILPASKGEYIMTIKRLATPAIDSDIHVYNSKWEELPKAWTEPLIADWLASKDKTDLKNLDDALPFIMYSADYDPATRVLTLSLDTIDYIARENRDFVSKMLRPELKFAWNGKKFTPIKQ